MVTKGVSVLMPLYNGVEFLADSVPSFLSQTLNENMELIIGINGYDENNRDAFHIATRWITQSEKKQIRVLNFPKSEIKGKSAALNEMIKYANYETIALLDVDDVWLPDKLKKQVPLLQQGYSVVGSQCVYFGGDRRFDGIVPSIPLMDFTEEDFFKVNPIINSSVVLRLCTNKSRTKSASISDKGNSSHALEKCESEKKELCHWNSKWDGLEDYDLWLRLKKDPDVRFWNVPEILVKHRIHKRSAFNSKGNNLLVSELLAQHRRPD